MKPFEIPYNFDTQLIDFLNIYKDINLHCIYIPPFKDHYICAKRFYRDIPHTLPETLKEYEYHIQYIQKFFPNKIMLLLQQNDICISKELLKYYINDLKITKFCVGSIEQANEIKNILSIEDDIIGSITMKIDSDKLQNIKEYLVFSGFVLWFPFNRNIQKIKELPKNFKYVLLVNCGCSIYCNGTHHWLANNSNLEYQAISKCPRILNSKFENIITIPPYDIQYFEPYIDYIKLQGREYTTTKIINDITYWNNNKYSLQELQLQKSYNPKQIYHIE